MRKYLRDQAAINAECKLVEKRLFDLQLISIVNKYLLDILALCFRIFTTKALMVCIKMRELQTRLYKDRSTLVTD